MIYWLDMIGPLALVVIVLGLIAFAGWLGRHRAQEQLDSVSQKQQRSQHFKDLQSWLREKLAYDLADADNKTIPYIKAFIEIVHMSGSVDELRPIAEVYRYRRGFKNEWIGE